MAVAVIQCTIGLMHWLKEHGSQILVGIILGVSLGANLYLYLTLQDMQTAQAAERVSFQEQLSLLSSQLTTANATIADLRRDVTNLEEDKDDLRDELRDERERNEAFEGQIRDIAGTVGDLDKLSKTDEELLQKYSKAYFLNENFVPSDLREIDDAYVQDDREPEYFHGDAMKFLEDLMDEAEDDNIDITIISAYRSFEEQNSLKGQFTQVYGEGANAFSADQGFSEHQLGTTVDFGTSNITSAQLTFADTEAYAWLLRNAHRYGFVLSYPEDNGFYVFEPWHWRFVGKDLARDLDRADAHFYDWEQRRIDEYLLNIFD